MTAAKTDLLAVAEAAAQAWRSQVCGVAAGAQVKVLRMDSQVYPDEVHDFDEALLVLQGQMNLEIGGECHPVGAGEMFIVPAGVPHAVAPGSHGTLVIIDR